MLENLKKYDILLASNSPRRRELLSGLDISYKVTALPDIDESYPSSLTGADIPLYISKIKSKAYRPMMNDDTLLITADTIVWLEGKVYGKPHSAKDARLMLKTLSGKTHEVITGVTICTKNKELSFTVTSQVSFGTLEDEEINYYIDRYKPFDKAGAYGIQEWIGYIGVTGISGSYYNVMGLPVQRLYRELKTF
ncbi:Maf-like protein [Coprobacter tertius]|uniref:dTTP/UTP pyrophosphatase n=1 Tax=Coprobacter tertius TaxID=2944915 RepID=A0ABT1MIT0_9BACT|nr:Maf-like protein [Coprobacter tertius]MCP9611771.1 Maf-like protein [Coprobacter tertius]